jgi:hypothetical protein
MNSVFFYYLGIISMLVWLFPPIRQYGTRFFIFFLVYAFADILGSFYGKYIDPGTNFITYILIAAVAYISIQEKENLKKYYFIYVGLVTAGAGIFLAFPGLTSGALIITAFNLLTVFTLFKYLLDHFFNTKSVNIFLAVLIFYQITTITKLATLLTGFQNDYFYFGTTTALQILIGLFFSIFRYEQNRLIFQFR